MPTSRTAVEAAKQKRDVTKINTRLMDENMTLKQFISEQAKYIQTMNKRKDKAHRRLKALRELNRHVDLLQAENAALEMRNELLQQRLLLVSSPRQMPRFGWFSRVIEGN